MIDKLEGILLNIGGIRMVKRPEPHISQLIDGGKIFKYDIEKYPGEQSQCHRNVCKLFFDRDISIATGYALSEDDIWRQHSWCFTGSSIIETTVSRKTYYGILLYGDEEKEFIFGNFGDKILKQDSGKLHKLFSKDQLQELKVSGLIK